MMGLRIEIAGARIRLLKPVSCSALGPGRPAHRHFNDLMEATDPWQPGKSKDGLLVEGNIVLRQELRRWFESQKTRL